MDEISWSDFERVELRVGTVTRAEAFPEARLPAFRLWIDFGEAIGEKKSSARITDFYRAEELVGRQVIAVVNFPKKQIGPFMSECLVTGFETADGVVLAVPDRPVEPGRPLR